MNSYYFCYSNPFWGAIIFMKYSKNQRQYFRVSVIEECFQKHMLAISIGGILCASWPGVLSLKACCKGREWVIIFHMSIKLSAPSREFCKVERWHDCPPLMLGTVTNNRLLPKLPQTNKLNLFQWLQSLSTVKPHSDRLQGQVWTIVLPWYFTVSSIC